jgi:hypothetical protein
MRGSPLVLSRVHWVEPNPVREITYLTSTAAHDLLRAPPRPADDWPRELRRKIAQLGAEENHSGTSAGGAWGGLSNLRESSIATDKAHLVGGHLSLKYAVRQAARAMLAGRLMPGWRWGAPRDPQLLARGAEPRPVRECRSGAENWLRKIGAIGLLRDRRQFFELILC